MPINSFLYPGASGPPTPYEVANSLRFNGDNFLSRTNPSATSTNDKKGTFSFWIKRASFPNESQVLVHQADSSTKRFALQIANNDEFIFSIRNDAESVDIDGTTTLDRVYRDVGAWTNFVFNYDTSGGTNGCKLFVNGTEQALTYSNTLPQNFVMVQNTSSFANHTIGRDSTQSSNFWTGYMTEVMFVDGQQLAPTEFGEYDSDSPTIWKPKDITGIDVGNLGYYLDFENSGALGTDAKGVGNFSTTNCAATDQSTDTCTNNFITLNPLDMTESTGRTFSEGNLNYTSDSSNASSARGTFGVNSGKWYYEVKIVSQSGSASSTGKFGTFGFADIAEYSDPATNGLTIIADSRLRGQGSTSGSQAGSSIWGAGDILMFALDLDNQNLYVGKNGNWRASDGDFDDSSPSSAIFTSIDTTKFWTPFGQKNVSANNTLSYSMNFGSPAFSISSGNSDANSHGNFEYAVPSNYFALNTKNLAEFG